MAQQMSSKQAQMLAFIDQYIQKHGYSPTVREIGQAMGLKSTSTVHGYLKRLEKHGALQRESGKSRVIQVSEDQNFPRHSVEHLPVVGRVTAGLPILAEENIEDSLPLPKDFLHGDPGDHFVLTIKGDSMTGVGINDGDYVIVKRQQTARDGEIVVALLENEATVKRLYKEKDCIRLQPENDLYEPIRSRDVQVLGKVVSLLRRY
ncbi:MAG: transcriptional repressor LexA [Christensenellales bacterium]